MEEWRRMKGCAYVMRGVAVVYVRRGVAVHALQHPHTLRVRSQQTGRGMKLLLSGTFNI
jgi:hypothetical protein